MWYGVSSIAARFINYLLTPYLTAKLTIADYGKMGLVYAAIPLLNVVFTYGFETSGSLIAKTMKPRCIAPQAFHSCFLLYVWEQSYG